MAVIEPEPQLGAHRDRAADAFHDAYDVRRLVARRHEIDHPDRSTGGGPLGLQDQGVAAVVPAVLRVAVAWADLPVAVLVGAEQRGEAGRRVEPGGAQPVDR